MTYRPKYPDSPFLHVADLVNPTSGKTYREENLELKHNIPLGTLVEVRYDEWYGDGACEKVHARLWVVSHDRDCDGTPLYGLSRWDDPEFAQTVHGVRCGFGEENLTVIELTEEVKRGDNVLEWK